MDVEEEMWIGCLSKGEGQRRIMLFFVWRCCMRIFNVRCQTELFKKSLEFRMKRVTEFGGLKSVFVFLVGVVDFHEV